jgi:hypothetical protein
MTATADLIRELERTRDETLEYFSLGDADLARTYGPGKWSVRFLLHHITDSESVFFYRIRQVISEPHQVVWFYDQDAWAKGLDYGHLPLELSRSIYEPVRGAIVHHARIHYERDGAREFVHSVSGLHTLQYQFDDVAAHNEHHLTQIRAALQRGGDGARSG